MFQDSRTPLTVWFEAVWRVATSRSGVSAQELFETLPIGSYQTAWTMLGKLRAAMGAAEKQPLSGVVEVDEWYHGGVAKGGHSLTGKTLVAAAIEKRGRGFGRLRLGVIPNRSVAALRAFVRANVEPGSLVITDGLAAYRQALAGYRHDPRNESAPDAPAAHVLLPGVHRVFSLADRWLLSTHQGGVQAEHLPEYLDEFVFRFNRRNAGHRGLLFYRLLGQAVTAPPVTYRDLVRIQVPKRAFTAAPPGSRSLPGTLDVADARRPWRQ